MADHSCFPVVVDGVPSLVRGDPGMSPEARAALADLIRAATARAAQLDAERTPEERARIEAVRARNHARIERLRRG